MSQRPESPLTPIMVWLETRSELDPVVRAATPVMRAVSAWRPLEDVLRGKPMGHAIHPILVQVPLGTWLGAALLDAVGGPQASDSAQVLTAAGLIGSVPAAVTGWAELGDAGQREKRVGVVHAAANATGVVLQAVAMRQRGRGHRGSAIAWSGMALGVLGVAGYLGGHLTVARKVGTRDVAFSEQH